MLDAVGVDGSFVPVIPTRAFGRCARVDLDGVGGVAVRGGRKNSLVFFRGD